VDQKNARANSNVKTGGHAGADFMLMKKLIIYCFMHFKLSISKSKGTTESVCIWIFWRGTRTCPFLQFNGK